jgi:hypothetical protein
MSGIILPPGLASSIAEEEERRRHAEAAVVDVLAGVVPFLPGNRVVFAPRPGLLAGGAVLAERASRRLSPVASAPGDPRPAPAPRRPRAGRRRRRRH